MEIPTARDGIDRPDETAARIREHGISAAALAPLLAAIDSGALSEAGLVDALAATEQARALLDAAHLRAIAQLDAKHAGLADEKDYVREDVATALRISPLSARNRLQLARQLTGRFPHAFKALEAGAITIMHARALVDECAKAGLDGDEAGWVDQLALATAQTQTVGEFARTVRGFTTMLRNDAETHERELADRRVAVRAVSATMGDFYLNAPLDQLAYIKAVLDALARRTHPGDARTADQRRADVACALLSGAVHPDTVNAAVGAATSGDTAPAAEHSNGPSTTGVPRTHFENLPREHGMRPTVLVTVPIGVLAGDSDAPGELAGFGPIPAHLARRIAADPTGTWRRLLVDDRGRLLDCGRTTYRPPADLARHVIARDRTCCFPGCTSAAARCELDHCDDWGQGGQTNADNLYALCRRHHHLKHDTNWRYRPLPDGALQWTSPNGRTYRREPNTYFVASPAFGPAARRDRPPERARLPDDPPF